MAWKKFNNSKSFRLHDIIIPEPFRIGVYTTNRFISVCGRALDAENLCEESEDQFTHDFGDNKFPFYKGNNSIRLTEELIDEDNPINHESDQQVQQCLILKEYIPPSVLRFLMHPNPIRLARNNNV